MGDPKYLAELELGNIGVVLGSKSGGLCSIDIDDDDEVQPFLAVNPKLQGSLRSKGHRGCNIWVRMVGDYPRSSKITDFKGDAWGEWRANGNQTIIDGKHPNGMDYQLLVEAPPVQISYHEIVWPKNINNPPALSGLKHDYTEGIEGIKDSDGLDGTEVTNDTAEIISCKVSSSLENHQDLSLPPVPQGFAPKTVKEILPYCTPTCGHTNHWHIFQLARGMLNLKEYLGRKLTEAELKDAFGIWCAANKFLRPELSKEEYWVEFWNSYHAAKVPLGQEGLNEAWRRAQERSLPPEAIESQTPLIQRLIALCYQLQLIHGMEPFFLSCRQFSTLINGERSKETVAGWLNYLVHEGILRIALKGGPKTMQATRFYYASLVSLEQQLPAKP